MFHDREPQAGPSRGARPGVVHAIEALEDTRQVLRRDAAARVHHRDPDRGGPGLRGNPHAPRVGVLDRVVEEVPERGLDPGPVEERAQTRTDREIELEAPPRRGLLETRRHVPHDLGQVPVLRVESRVGPVQVSQLE